MREFKTAVIGAGSTYTPELISGFIERAGRLGARSFAFCDTDTERGEILAGMARRMFRRAGVSVEIEATGDLREAVRGASYVLAQIRVGKMPARILDEKIPLRHGLLGQETTGLGGLSCALRTIPVVHGILEATEELAEPGAWLINFSNPSGLVAEALLGRRPDARVIGLCNIPVKMRSAAAGLLRMDGLADCDFAGLNHLCWMTGVFKDGRELLSDILSRPIESSGLNNIPDMEYTPAQLRAIGGFPCGYLNYYYFREEMLARCMAEEKTRGEVCLELERRLLEIYADPAVDTPPELLKKRGGAMYSQAAVSLIEAIELDSGAEHVVNVRNGGMLPMLAPGDVAELRCRVTRDGPEPLPRRTEPGEHICGLVRSVKAYEKLAARAAFSGEYSDALAAALSHPLSSDIKRTQSALGELMSAHRRYLPQFKDM